MIQDILLEHFRAHKNTRLHLHPLHAVVGENGTGKTSILEAINLACSNSSIRSRIGESDFNIDDEADIRVRVAFDKYFVVDIPDGFTTQRILAKGCDLTIKRRQRASPGRALAEPLVHSSLFIPAEYDDSQTLQAELLPTSIRPSDLSSAVTKVEDGLVIKRKTGSKLKLRKDRMLLSYASDGYPNVFYFGKKRENQSRVGFNSLLTRVASDLNWRFRHKVDLPELSALWDQFYSTVANAIHGDSLSKLMKDLAERSEAILGTDLSDLELSLLALEEPFSKSFLSSRTSTNQIALDNLGSGVSLIVTLCLLELVASRSSTEIIVLVDEPELHLHPQLQNRLLQHLTASDFQVIYSTHSPRLVPLHNPLATTRLSLSLESFPNDSILKEEVLENTIEAHLADIKTFFIDKSVYVADTAKILFARKAVLVEGPAEQYGIPQLANALGKDISDLTFFPCHGKNKIPHFAILCRSFGVPFYIVFDKDGEGVSSKDNSPIVAVAENEQFYGFEDSFEVEFGIGRNAKHKVSKVLECIENIGGEEDLTESLRVLLDNISSWSDSV